MSTLKIRPLRCNHFAEEIWPDIVRGLSSERTDGAPFALSYEIFVIHPGLKSGASDHS